MNKSSRECKSVCFVDYLLSVHCTFILAVRDSECLRVIVLITEQCFTSQFYCIRISLLSIFIFFFFLLFLQIKFRAGIKGQTFLL